MRAFFVGICVCSIVWGLWQQRRGEKTMVSTQADRDRNDEPSGSVDEAGEVAAMTETDANGLETIAQHHNTHGSSMT